MAGSSMAIMAIVSAAASTTAAVVQAQQQKQVVKAERDENLRQNMMQTRDAEIKRLEEMKQTLASNMLAASLSGTHGGTQEDIIQGNITKGEKDVAYIQQFGSANAAAIRGKANRELKGLRESQILAVGTGIVSGAAGVASANANQALTASQSVNTATGSTALTMSPSRYVSSMLGG